MINLLSGLKPSHSKPSVVKDRGKRAQVVADFKSRRNLRALSQNRTVEGRGGVQARYSALYELQGMNTRGGATKVRNRCALTGKGRGMAVKRGRVSMAVLRTLIHRGKLSGYTKV